MGLRAVTGAVGLINNGADITVATFANLPSASANPDKMAIVLSSTGVKFVNKKYAGTYVSDGANWNLIEETDGTSASIDYDNTASGLTATTIKAAIDELEAEKVTGPASATDNSVAVYDGATGKLLKDAGLALSIDNVNIRAGFGVFPTHQVHTELITDDNIFIDGRTNPRTITLGAMRQEHTAGVAGTRAYHIDINSAGFDDTSGIVMRHNLLNSSALIRPKCLNLHADVTGATNAHINFLEFSITGDLDASMRADAIDIRHGISPIHHHSGATVAADTVFKFDDSTTTYTDITTEAGSAGSDVTIFDEDDDYVYWGDAAQFATVEVILATGAGNPGIKPTFEYSKGSSVWGTLSVSDDTNGFRENGNIFYAEPSDWAVDTVNAVASKFWVRIKRTANTISPVPTEDTLKIASDTEYEWDKNGDVNLRTLLLEANAALALTADSNGANTVPIAKLENTAGDISIFRVDATPEGSVTGSRGDIAFGVVGGEGVIYLKHLGDGTNTGWRLITTQSYADIHIHENSTATQINTVDIPHLVQGLFSEQLSSLGFTFDAGETGAITAFADASGGKVRLTSAGHTVTNGKVFNIAGTTNYNGVFIAENVQANTIDFTDTWVADDATGNFYKGDNLTVDTGSDGLYKIDFHTYGSPASSNKDFEFRVYKNTAFVTNLHATRRYAAVDIGSTSGGGLVELADGDILTFAVICGTDTTNFTIDHVNLNVTKINGG